MDIRNLQIIFTDYLWFLLALSIHQWGHAWVAHRLGDNSPVLAECLTLNPLAHMSFLGTVVIPLLLKLISPEFVMIGWGRPVVIDVNQFKYRKFGDILCHLAGPFMNFIFGFLILSIGFFLGRNNNSLWSLCLIGTSVNIGLGLVNFIPIPPLDGSHILKIIIGMKEESYLVFSQVGTFLLIVLINLPIFDYYFHIGYHFIFERYFSICKMLFC